MTGANGQLGQCLQKIAPNYKDLAFIFKSSKDLDITHKEQMNSLFAVDNFDYCINCAAYTNVEQAEKTPEIAFKVNAEGVKNLALICREYDTSLIHISTDYVFDGEKKEPYTVDDIPNPINEYGKSKLLGERHIQEIMENYIIIRTSWLYSEFGKNFYTTILKKAKNGDSLIVTDQQTGRPTNANNLARYIITFTLKSSNLPVISHFTDEETMTWYSFAKNIIKDSSLGVCVNPDNKTSKKIIVKRPVYSVLNTEEKQCE